MRIELPSTSWADTHRVQDDAHTLTLPWQRPLMLTDKLLHTTEAGETVRMEVAALQHAVLTLTL